jgi:dTMP kinase
MIIAFEGIDGSGKETQSKLFCEYLKSINKDFLYMDFPAYNKTFFSKEIIKYLNKGYGSMDEIHPKFIAMLYAGDRLELKDKINRGLKENKIIVCNRYTPSNIAHQVIKAKKKEKEELRNWINKLEVDIFKIPKYDFVIFLDVPFDTSDKMVETKNTREYTNKDKDIHEENEPYMRKVYNEYQNLSLSKNWIKISCMKNNKIKPINDIAKEVIESINKTSIFDKLS